MFRTVIVGPDRELCARLQAALESTGHVEVSRTIDHYPQAIDLVRALRAHATEILFISFESVEKALETVELLEAEASHVQVAAFDRRMDLAVVRESMRIGLREFLVDPFERSSVLEALEHLRKLLQRRPAFYGATNEIFSFLPSKAGAGTSTIALNVSAALARTPDALASELGRAFAQFADSLVEEKNRDRANGKRKFLEFFTTPTQAFASSGK